MATSLARRRSGALSRTAGADAPAHRFEAAHLENVARSAGEAFAWTGEEAAPVARGGYGATAIWLTVGAVAGVGLYVAF